LSAFDDEFGLFGDDEAPQEEERKSTLGARQIATNESFSDDIEPEDERPARRRSGGAGSDRSGGGERRPYRDRDHGPRPAGDPAVAQARAVELLTFLAKRLVSVPDDVVVHLVEGARGPIIELEVNPEDFGKVIGKGGRVAQALRTIVRASAEGKVSIDIVDIEDDDPSSSSGQAVHEADLEHAGDTSASEDEGAADAVAADPEAAPIKKAAPKKKAAAKKSTAAKKKNTSAAAAPKRKKKS
jgi:uncharacterized protein